MKKMVRGAGGLLGVCLLLMVAGMAWARRGPEPQWLLYSLDGYRNDLRLVWFEIQTGNIEPIRFDGRNRVFSRAVSDGHQLHIVEMYGQCFPICFRLDQMRWDGSQLKQLTQLRSEFSRISPDEQYLMYGDQNLGLMVRSIDGGDPVSISQQLPPEWGVFYTDDVFSPDGQWMALTATNRKGDYDVYRVQVNGTGLENLTNGLRDFHKAELWLPNGWLIVSSQDQIGNDLSRLHPDTQEAFPLTDAPHSQVVEWLPEKDLLLIEENAGSNLVAIRTTNWTIAWQRAAISYATTWATPNWVVMYDDLEWVIFPTDGGDAHPLWIPEGMTGLAKVWRETPNGEWLLVFYENWKDNNWELWRFHLQNHTYEKLWESDKHPFFANVTTDHPLALFSTSFSGNGGRRTTTYALSSNGQGVEKVANAPNGDWLGVTLQSDEDFSRAGLLIIGAMLVGSYFLRKRRRPS